MAKSSKVWKILNIVLPALCILMLLGIFGLRFVANTTNLVATWVGMGWEYVFTVMFFNVAHPLLLLGATAIVAIIFLAGKFNVKPFTRLIMAIVVLYAATCIVSDSVSLIHDLILGNPSQIWVSYIVWIVVFIFLMILAIIPLIMGQKRLVGKIFFVIPLFFIFVLKCISVGNFIKGLATYSQYGIELTWDGWIYYLSHITADFMAMGVVFLLGAAAFLLKYPDNKPKEVPAEPAEQEPVVEEQQPEEEKPAEEPAE